MSLTQPLARKDLTLQVPLSLLRKQPPAKFSISDDAHLTITVGDVSLIITPADMRRLDAFMGQFAGAAS